jgi:hypothetical protein
VRLPVDATPLPLVRIESPYSQVPVTDTDPWVKVPVGSGEKAKEGAFESWMMESEIQEPSFKSEFLNFA